MTREEINSLSDEALIEKIVADIRNIENINFVLYVCSSQELTLGNIKTQLEDQVRFAREEILKRLNNLREELRFVRSRI